MLMQVNDLDVRYDRIHALRSFSLELAQGEVVAILGANGAGKTSLLRALQGTVRPAAGRISLEGEDVTTTSAPSRVRKGLVLVPEGRQIFVSLSVHENLLMGGYTREPVALRRDIESIYDRFPNLAMRRDQLASVLSGGEQQMLAIGRALVTRPKIMMLDEPSLGLSPLIVERIFDLLGELNRDGLTILLVEQNTAMALAHASRILVLRLGHVIATDTPAAIVQKDMLAGAYLGTV